MDTTTKTFILYEKSEFYQITPAGRQKLTTEQMSGLKSGYVLVVADSELFYTTMEFPDAPKRKLDMFISNYLQGTFPQQLCSHFCYMSKGEKILIGIFNSAFSENIDTYTDIFSKASAVTSPMADAYSRHDTFSYVAGGMPISIEEGLISNTCTAENPVEQAEIPSGESKLTIPFARRISASVEAYRVPAALLIACFILFAAGDYMRLKGYKKQLKSTEQVLTDIYEKAGVAKSRDPYGKLLAMAGGGDEAQVYTTLFILEKISKAHNKNITTNTIDIKGANVTFQGSSRDYTYLEEFKKNISDATGKDAQIIDTVKKDNEITFTLRMEI